MNNIRICLNLKVLAILQLKNSDKKYRPIIGRYLLSYIYKVWLWSALFLSACRMNLCTDRSRVTWRIRAQYSFHTIIEASGNTAQLFFG